MSSAARTTPGGIRKRTVLTAKNLQQNCTNTPAALVPSVFEIVDGPHYSQTGFVECLVTRDITAPKPRYSLTFQSTQASSRWPAIVAEKKSSVGGHYQLFDMSRAGPAEAVLSKKAGHYIGKLRQDSDNSLKKSYLHSSKVSYSLYDAKEDKQRIGAFLYDAPSLVSQWRSNQPPRKLCAIVATSTTTGRTRPTRMTDGCCALPYDWPARAGVGVDTDDDDDTTCLFCSSNDPPNDNAELHVLKTKKPFFDAGQYRLNFAGRVTVPSVKNFQLENAKGDIVLQFGRVSDHKFHLDFKHPFSAALAFSVALTQFDI
mmetsp:Transcript_27982/g.56666  ORF Transcript_27982/g.56666 Transcript_27982/m.56666 type:complete len:315 (+) Transcript_27982:445-1389(+)